MSATPDRIDILAECIRVIESGEMTIDDCVARYPGVLGLADKLRLAMAIAELGVPTLAESRKTALERRLVRAMQEKARTQHQAVARRSPIGRWFVRLVSVAAVLALVLGLGGVVARLSHDTIPGDMLYGYKRAVEQIELAFASAPDRAELLAQHARARLSEAQFLAIRGAPIDSVLLAELTASVNAAIEESPSLAIQVQLYDESVRSLRVLATVDRAASQAVTEAIETLKVPSGSIQGTLQPPVPASATLTSVGVLASATQTASRTWSPTPTSTWTLTPTATASPTPTASATREIVPPVGQTSAAIQTDVVSPSPTASATSTPSVPLATVATPTAAPSVTPSFIPVMLPTNPPLLVILPTSTFVITTAPTNTPIPTITPSATNTASPLPSATPTESPTPLETETPTPPTPPTETATLPPCGPPTEEPTHGADPGQVSGPSPTPTQTPTPCASWTPSPTHTETPTPTQTETSTATATPTPSADSTAISAATPENP